MKNAAVNPRKMSESELPTNSPTMSKSWYVYMIEADNGSLYTGITTDVSRRFNEHAGSPRGARYFNGRRPTAIRYVEPFCDRSSASKREYLIKSLTAKQKRQLIDQSGVPSSDYTAMIGVNSSSD